MVDMRLLIILAIALSVSCSGGGPSTTRDKIDGAAATVLACEPAFPGMAIGVVQDGKTLLKSGYGYKSLSTQQRHRVNAKTLFGIGSITKSFTAALVLKMLENAKLDRNAKVADLLGKDFRFRDDLLTKQVTVGDLLSHWTGIPGYNFLLLQKNYSRNSIFRDMAYLNNTGAFRDSFLYSNIGYGLAAHITELLDKKKRTWEDMVTEELFVPLGMRKSYLRNQKISRTNVALPHIMAWSGKYGTVSQNFLDNHGNIGAATSVMSSASDMIQWMRLLLHGGISVTGDRILSEDVVETMFRPVVASEWKTGIPVKPDAPETFIHQSYASGLRNGFYRGYKVLGYRGSTYGYDSLMTLMPSKNVGVFIAVNGNDWNARASISLTLYILDVLLGNTPWLNNLTLCSFPMPWSKPRPSPRDTPSSATESPRQSGSTQPGKSKDTPPKFAASPQLARYTGKYFTPGFGEVSVSLNTISNGLKLEYGVFKAVLVPKQGDNFIMMSEGDTWFVSDSVVTFTGDGRQIKSLHIPAFSQQPIFIKQLK